MCVCTYTCIFLCCRVLGALRSRRLEIWRDSLCSRSIRGFFRHGKKKEIDREKERDREDDNKSTACRDMRHAILRNVVSGGRLYIQNIYLISLISLCFIYLFISFFFSFYKCKLSFFVIIFLSTLTLIVNIILWNNIYKKWKNTYIVLYKIVSFFTDIIRFWNIINDISRFVSPIIYFKRNVFV